MKLFKLIWVVQSRFKKYFAFAVGQITASSSPVSRSQEGRTRRHERGVRMRWTQTVSQDERYCGRTAKSCGPDTPTLVSSS